MIEFYNQDDILICEPEVNVVASNISRLRDILIEKLDSKHDWKILVFDCKKINTLDSMGINLLVGLFKKAKSTDKEFKVIGCNESILKVLKLFKLTERFTVEALN